MPLPLIVCGRAAFEQPTTLPYIAKASIAIGSIFPLLASRVNSDCLDAEVCTKDLALPFWTLTGSAIGWSLISNRCPYPMSAKHDGEVYVSVQSTR